MACNVCTKRVLNHSYHLKCDSCKSIVHINCLPNVSKNDPLYTQRETSVYFCSMCLRSIFPFNHLDYEDYIKAISESWDNDPLVTLETLNNQELIFSPFDLNEDYVNPLNDIDPDQQFYHDMFRESLSSCDYFLENTFNEKISREYISDNSFSLLHVNIRSVPKNLNSLTNYLETLKHKFSIIGLSETWLKDHNVDRHQIDAYTAVHRFRSHRYGGGVSIYTASSLEYFTRDDLCHQSDAMESVFIEIDKSCIGKDRNVIVGVIYRPPNSDAELFNNTMSELLNKMKTERKFIYCMGDYNLSLLNYDTHSPTQEFTNMMYSHACLPCITKPTRVTRKTASLIDNIFCNKFDIDVVPFTGILYTDISDHFPVFYIDPSAKSKPTPNYFKKRIFSIENSKKFANLLCEQDWAKVFSIDDPQEAYTTFSEVFNRIFEQCFPLRTFKCGYRTRKPWLSDGLKISIAIKNKLYFRKQKSKNDEHELIYRKYRNKLNTLIAIAEKEHYDALFSKYKNNLKSSWRVLKDIISKKKTSTSCSRFYLNDERHVTNNKEVIANKFNDFFVNVGPNLAEKIPTTDKSPTYLMERNLNSMAVLPVTESEVISIIKNLKHSSPGWDSISVDIVKNTYSIFIQPLTYIMNLSVMKGIVPMELKIAKVIPLFKANDAMVFTNYRPVSVLPLFSKILERLMYSRLLSFVNKNRLLYSFQFGFRLFHSPDLALICLVDRISSALENGEYVLGLFLDFSKAFDTVNHEILFMKLEHLGIRDTPLNWFKSYLSDREQFVVYNDTNSSRQRIICGVPQGSILGPVLFLLYINDLAKVSNVIFSLLFADDSNMFLAGKNPDDLVDTMNVEMVKVIEWLNTNRLSLNLKKTHFIIFRKKRSKLKLHKELVIDNVVINMTDRSKFLGVFLDQHLTFESHIKHIQGKVSKGIGILYKARKFVMDSTMLTLYYSFVYPYFTYCISIWGNTYITVLNPLIRCQKRAVRVICGARKFDHTLPLFQKSKLLNLKQLYIYSVQLFLYKYHNGNLPDVFNNFFVISGAVHGHETRQINHFRVPRADCFQRSLSLKIAGSNIYNEYIDQIDYNCTYPKFKSDVKKTLLRIQN